MDRQTTLLDKLVSTVIQEDGQTNYMEWSLNEDGSLIYSRKGKNSNRGINETITWLIGMLLSQETSHTSILYYRMTFLRRSILSRL